MANIPLKSMNFPGLPDTYTVPESIFGPLSTPPTAAEQAQARANIGAAGYDAYPAKTLASAPIHSFSDGADNIPIKAMEVAVRAVQDLHGYANPWPAGGGKNKLNPTGTSKTQDGITYTKQGDGRFTATGSNTHTTATACLVGEFAVKSGETYTLSGCPASGSLSSYRLDIRTAPTTLYDNDSTDYGSGYTFTASADATLYVYMRFAYQYAISGTLTFAPMVRLSSVSDATFAPYENICPIVGWDEAQIVGSGKNILDNKRGSAATTINGVTFTPQSDGSVIVNGTASGGAAIYTLWNRGSDNVRLPAGTYTLSGCPSDGTTSTYFMQWQCTRDGALAGYGNDTGNGLTATTREGDIQQATIRVANGATANNLRFYPQLELGSTKTAYEPYRGRIVTISFNGTVYGGPFRYVGGKEWEFTPQWAKYTATGTEPNIVQITNTGVFKRYRFDNFAASAPNFTLDVHSNMADNTQGNIWATNGGNIDSYGYRVTIFSDRVRVTYPVATVDEFKAALAALYAAGTPMEFIYPIADATSITLTADAEVVTVHGDNAMFCGCGDSILTYRRDPTLALEQLEAAIVALQGGGALSLSAPLSMSRPDALEPAVELTAESGEGAETE